MTVDVQNQSSIKSLPTVTETPVVEKTPSEAVKKTCLTKSIKFGDDYLISKGYKKKKDGSWKNSKGF